jgi:hypothetical protein
VSLPLIAALALAGARSDGQEADALAIQRQYQAERAAIREITRLGGWVETERRGDFDTVVEVNMVYHEHRGGKRLDNSNVSSDALGVVPTFANLRRLLLKETQATDAALAHIRGMRHLERIYLWDASLLTNKGVEHLATLPSLKYVHLSQSAISDEALLHFSRIETLEGLSLQQNSFTDEGMRHLTPLKNLKELYVGLGQISVTDVGLEPLSKLENLETLDLQHSAITDDGLIYLVNLKKLRSLWLNGTRVTKPAADMLQQAIPGLQVTF